MREKIFYILIFMLIILPALKAQVKVTGIVVNKQTLEPVSGATVFVTGTSIVTSTDDYGKFMFSTKLNSFTLSLKRIGYLSKNVRVSNTSKPLYIRLSPSPIELTGVQVVGNQTISTYFAYNRSFEQLAGEIDGTDFYERFPVSNAAYLANNSHIKIRSFRLGVTDIYRLYSAFIK